MAQGGQFLLNSRNASFGQADLSDYADQFGTDPPAFYRLRAVFIFVENALEGVSVAYFVGAWSFYILPQLCFDSMDRVR